MAMLASIGIRDGAKLSSSELRQAIENIPIAVMTCDPKSFKITYANKSSRESLNDLSKLLPPGVNGDTIVGQCIDIFHKSPSHQRRLLADPSNLPHTAVVRLGHELLELHISALKGGMGGGIATLMLTWRVVTQRENLRRMIDNLPINVMMCDTDTLSSYGRSWVMGRSGGAVC